MPTVVTFWWLPDEEEAFLEYLDSTAEIVAFPFDGTEEKGMLVAHPVRQFIQEHNPRQLFIGTRELDETIIEPVEIIMDSRSVRRFRVIDMKSCVLGYDRGRFLGPCSLCASNLYYYSEFPSATGELMKKPAAFLRWAKDVRQWVCKATPEWHQFRRYRVSTRAKNAIVQDGLEILSY